MSDRNNLIGGVLLGCVVAAVAVAPSFGDHSANRKTDARIEALESELKKVAASQRSLDARVFHLEEMRETMEADIARVIPQDARWIEFAREARDQWDFDKAGRVQIIFEGWSETGTFGFQMTSRAGETHGEFRPGTSLTAVDDKGTSQMHYTMTLHEAALDRDGRPYRGLVSVTVESK